MKWPNFVGPSSQNLSALADCERTMNLYVEAQDSAANRAGLYVSPGFMSYIGQAGGITDVGGRGLFQMNSRAHAIIGGGVYEAFATQTATRRGDVAQDANPALMTTNGIGGNQLGISSGNNFYSLNLATNVLSAAVLTGEATQIGMIDGYGVIFNKALGKVRLSNLNDFTTCDPTQFVIRSAAPDNWQAMLVNAPDVWLIGEQSGDVWFDAGNFPFPLAPRPGVSFKYGIAATFSIAAAGDSVLWLSKNEAGAGIVVRARGYVPEPISSNALETAIARYARTSRIDDAEALTTQFEGHVLYVLRFPAADATWAYDLTQGGWIELGKWDPNANRYHVWSPRATCYAFGKHLTVETGTGIISDMDITYYTETDGSAKRWIRVPPPLEVADGADRMFIDSLRIGVETGLGLVTGQGSNPTMMMRASLNHGKTWGVERTVPVGRMGDFDEVVQFNLCGSSRTSWTPEFSGSDPIPWRLIDATVVGSGIRQGQS